MGRSNHYYEQAYECLRLSNRAVDPETKARLLKSAEDNAAMGKALDRAEGKQVEPTEASPDIGAVSAMALVLLLGAATMTLIRERDVRMRTMPQPYSIRRV